jgi:hypothetical protein
MNFRISAISGSLLLAITTLMLTARASEDSERHEVWVIDQSDTTSDGGGTLYIYKGNELAGQDAAAAAPEVIDLGGAARSLCLSLTGTAPRRPHMFMFNATHSHAILSFVATGHVLFMDAATRTPLDCVDVGVQAHAAFPSQDQSYVIVADQNGKKLHRILTDYATNTFTLAATLDLATGTTPSGAPKEGPGLRPDNAPICPVIESTSRFTFVTLRGGGLFVVNTKATPMDIVAEYDNTTVHPNGCGGVETAGKVYINAGGGTTANPLESDLYAFPLSGFSTTPNPPNTPAPAVIFSHDDRGFVDSHGGVLTKHSRFIWVADRAANNMVVVDAARDAVVNEFSLVGKISGDPAPDLMDISPSGNRVYVSLRGPNPLTGNAPGVNNAVGSTPGVGVIRVEKNGQRGVLQSIARITHITSGVERADPHGLKVRVY